MSKYHWVIANCVEGEWEYWSNSFGWGGFDEATRFTEDERNSFHFLPCGGEWQRVESKLPFNPTPSPWTVEPTTDFRASFRVMDEGNCTVALCYQQPYDTWQAEDNARLVATAPDLLEALRAAEHALFCCEVDWSELTDNQHGAFPGLKALNQVRKAIAKATGEEDE